MLLIDIVDIFVYTEILTDKSINNVVNFLKNVIKDFEEKTNNINNTNSNSNSSSNSSNIITNNDISNNKNKIKVILTDNGSEFTDRYAKDSKIIPT